MDSAGDLACSPPRGGGSGTGGGGGSVAGGGGGGSRSRHRRRKDSDSLRHTGGSSTSTNWREEMQPVGDRYVNKFISMVVLII